MANLEQQFTALSTDELMEVNGGNAYKIGYIIGSIKRTGSLNPRDWRK